MLKSDIVIPLVFLSPAMEPCHLLFYVSLAHFDLEMAYHERDKALALCIEKLAHIKQTASPEVYQKHKADFDHITSKLFRGAL